MIKYSKLTSFILTGALALSLLAGCGSKDTSVTSEATISASAEVATAAPEATTEVSSEEPSAEVSLEESSDVIVNVTVEDETAAKQLLNDLTGTYQELWPVLFSDEYTQVWLDNCTELVGAENAQASYEKLKFMVTGTIYGEEAAKTYTEENFAWDCGFIEGLNRIEFDGATSTIKGYGADSAELFSHTYKLVGIDENGLYQFETADADAGEFKYFCLAPDTSATTYHIEFRYGSDLASLAQYDTGAYAYWLASGISTEFNQTMIEDCIKLFCTENLSA